MRFLTGPMTQLAWVVTDIDVAEAGFARSHGVPHWTRMNDVHYGDSIYAEFLATHGSGPHHGCWETDDLDATLARSGRDAVQEGSMAGGELRFAYVEPGLPGLPFIEIVEVGPGMRAFFDAIKVEATR